MKQGKYQRKPVRRRRSNGTKLGLILLAVTMLIGSTIGGTFAYLVDYEAVKNTFTVGNVGTLTLTETGMSNNANSYKIIPGVDITKDPKVTYNAKGEDNKELKNIDAYVFVEVSPADANAGYQWTLKNGTDDTYTYVIPGKTAAGADVNFLSWTVNSTWTHLSDNVYYYNKKVLAGESLENVSIISNNTITVSAYITEDNIEAVAKAAGLTFTAYAIQADGFKNAAEAWETGIGK